jgi:hypothetical protein
MAQIDPSIAMGFRPIQIESPINQMAAISQLEGARQQRQMNMLQMQEYARKAKEDQDLAVQHNELAKIHGSGVKIGSPEYFNLVAAKAPRLLTNIMDQQTKRDALEAQRQAREAETEKREFELGEKREKLSRDKVNQAIADIAGFDDLVSINADIDRKLESGELTQDQANQIRSGLPADDSGIPAWQRNSLMKLMDLKDRITAMRDAEKPIVVDGQLVSPSGRVIFAGAKKPVSVAPGGRLVNPDTGEVVYESPDKPISVSAGGTVIDAAGNVIFKAPVEQKPISVPPGGTVIDAEGKVIFTAPAAEPKPMSVPPGGTVIDSSGNVIFTAPAAAAAPTTDERNYQAAKDSGFTGTFAQFLDQQKETADEREWRKAVANGTFKGTFIQWKQALRPVSTTNVAPPVQTVTVQGPNGPEMRDARTGRLITDDKGQALKPYDAGNKPLSPVQAQKLKKDQSVDTARITVAKDTADDIERNVDSLIGNEKKKIKPHKGLPGITGFNALIPSMPGSDARGAQQLLDNIKGKVTMMGKSIMSQEGKLGNMAVQEWKIVSDAVERLDPAAPNFADQLRNVVRQARRLENNLKAQHKTLYEAPAVNQSSSVRSEADAILDRK